MSFADAPKFIDSKGLRRATRISIADSLGGKTTRPTAKKARWTRNQPSALLPGEDGTYLLLIVKEAVLVTAPAEAVILTTVFLLTAVVVTVKVADRLPVGIVTVAGTDALVGVLLDKLTWNPPKGAGAVSVTVPSEPLPPRTLVGLSESADSTAAGCGFTVKDVDLKAPS